MYLSPILRTSDVTPEDGWSLVTVAEQGGKHGLLFAVTPELTASQVQKERLPNNEKAGNSLISSAYSKVICS